MPMNLSETFICDFDLSQTLDEFSMKKPKVFHNFATYLNEENLYDKLMDAAIEKRILMADVRKRIRNSQNCAVSLLNEFTKKCCTMELLCECMKGYGLQELYRILGVFEKMYIMRQPGWQGTRLAARLGGELKLTFLVEGYPLPSYRWYHNGLLVLNAFEATITLSNFSKEMEGKYYCIAEQACTIIPSVTVISDSVECYMLVAEPSLEVNLPPEIVCTEDQDVIFYVQPKEEYDGSYEWLHDNQILCRSQTNKLCIKNVNIFDRGEYRCILKNAAGELHSDKCILKVEVPIKPTFKLALLIGNSKYKHFKNLRTPCEDVNLLKCCLTQMGFLVKNCLNLPLSELNDTLTKFFAIIPRKSFVLFFFSGHGFEISNNKFFLPADCPSNKNYSLIDCVSHQYIIKQIIDKKPLLLVSVLDMCLRGPNKDNNPNLYSENMEHHGYDLSESSLIEACATSDYQNAYERKSEEYGLYCKCLCEHIRKDRPVVENFQKAHADFVRKSNNLQKPQLKFNNDLNDFRLSTKSLNDYNCYSQT